MTCFDCQVCFGSKFTSSVEGRRFNWLIYDSMTSLFACGRFSKSRGLSASVSFLPTFPFPFPLFYSLHSSPCNSLLPNCTETLATQATTSVFPDTPDRRLGSVFHLLLLSYTKGIFFRSVSYMVSCNALFLLPIYDY